MISETIKFTQLPVKLKYPPAVKGVLSTYHSKVITYVTSNYHNRSSYRRNITHILNMISFLVISGDTIPDSWNIDNPLVNAPDISEDIISKYLSKYDLYLVPASICWDVDETIADSDDIVKPDEAIESESKDVAPIQKLTTAVQGTVECTRSDDIKSATPKEDLYIQSPKIPQFNYDKVWAQGVVDSTRYVIYASRPEIPTKQNEISATTDVNSLLTSDVVKLYPNRFIRTRSEAMYIPIEGVEFDSTLGIILPIQGYNRTQLINNIIQYPHIYHLYREVNGVMHSFYSHIEISGELQPILEVWDTLPDTQNLPKTPEFIKEYTVRRYLLERDIKHIQHNYPLHGSLHPHLTLFAPPEMYEDWGYADIESIARQCVISRVSYKQTRNPILRRLLNG